MTSSHLYESIARNKRNTLILLVGVVSLLAGLGYVFGLYYGNPWEGLAIASGASILYATISFFSGDSLVLHSMGAKPTTKEDYPQLYNVTEEMAIAAGLPMPRIYVIVSDASNAFATGRNPQKASVTVTTGLLENLNREELQAVIGHEMAHIQNFDTRFAMLMAVMVGAIALLCDAFWRMSYSTSRRSSRSSSDSNSKDNGQLQMLIMVLAIVLAILAPIAAKMIQLAMSRQRELLADNTSAELTRNPGALARALGKIASDPDDLSIANRGTQHLFIANPLRAAKDAKKLAAGKALSEKAGWFDTHPPIALRIRLLEEMAHQKS